MYSLAANVPTSLTASIINSTSISVSWTAPVGGANGYIVVIMIILNKYPVLTLYYQDCLLLYITLLYMVIRCTISGQQYCIYTIKWYVTIDCSIAQVLFHFHLVPVQVSDVSVNAVTSTSMTVTWTPPNAYTYSVITQYNISYVTSCSRQTISSSTTVTHPTTSVTLTDLEEGLNYTITGNSS